MNNKFISLVIPCYNEELLIEHTLKVLTEKMKEYSFSHYEIILVDDGSKDKTLTLLQEYAQKDERIKVVSFSANRGQQVAVYAGMCYSSGDAVILMDADLQDPPECLPQIYRLWDQEGYDVVYGKRVKRDGESFLKKLTSYLFYRMFNYVSSIDIPKDVGDFRLMDRKVVDAFIQMEENNRFNRALVTWLGFKQTELLFERAERYAGETKWNWSRLFHLAKDSLFAFSYIPVLVIQLLGIFSIVVSVGLLVYAIISKIAGISVSGWSSLMVVLTFFSGSILFSLGIIGEYVARIHTEVIKRPLFIAAQTINLKDKKIPDHVARFISDRNKKLH